MWWRTQYPMLVYYIRQQYIVNRCIGHLCLLKGLLQYLYCSHGVFTDPAVSLLLLKVLHIVPLKILQTTDIAVTYQFIYYLWWQLVHKSLGAHQIIRKYFIQYHAVSNQLIIAGGCWYKLGHHRRRCHQIPQIGS